MPPHLHLLREQQAPRCYLSLRMLPRSHFPAFVSRRPGRSLLIVDPRPSRYEIAKGCIFLLTLPEIAIHRAAFGLPPIGQDMPRCFLDGPAFLYVPPDLRVPGEPAIQGGAELLRRYQEGTVSEELAMFALETQQAKAV